MVGFRVRVRLGLGVTGFMFRVELERPPPENNQQPP
jgi:hypothetical protein